ncbi:LOW QUALITY PROTEIN: conserved hypothetical protein, partial [Aspergillus lentulus]
REAVKIYTSIAALVTICRSKLSNDDKSFDLAHHLQTAVLIAMRAQNGMTLPPLQADMSAEMTESCSRSQQEWLKAAGLERDNYQCGVIKFRAEIPLINFGRTLQTELAHIIPFSLGNWERAEQVNPIIARSVCILGEGKAGTFCAYMQLNINGASRFNGHPAWLARIQELGPDPTVGYYGKRQALLRQETLYVSFPNIKDIIKPTTINTPANVMAANPSRFWQSEDYIPPNHIPRVPKVNQHLPYRNQDGERPVTFNQHADCELPIPVLLATHAAITEILHASGQAEQIDETLI